MAVTNLTLTDVGGGAFLLTWGTTLPPSPAPTFYVYRDGVLVTTTQQTSWQATVGPGESPVYEVLDDPAAVPGAVYPNYALLAWYATPATDQYLVEELLLPGPVWTERTRVDDDGSGYFTWASRILEDGQTHQFRVTPIGSNGNPGTARTFVLLMVRIPDPPAVAYTYNGAGTPTVTIAAA